MAPLLTSSSSPRERALVHRCSDSAEYGTWAGRSNSGDIVEYTVAADTLAVDGHIRDLRLPDGAVVAMLTSEREIIPPRGSTLVLAPHVDADHDDIDQ